MLSAQGLLAGKSIYRATPTVTQGLFLKSPHTQNMLLCHWWIQEFLNGVGAHQMEGGLEAALKSPVGPE
jgi:hypothetical protein